MKAGIGLGLAFRRRGFWQLPGASLDVDFGSARVFGASSFASLFSAARAGSAWAVDASGNLVSFGANVPRRHSAGLTIEAARTNSIRNSTAAGSVNGAPGTPPTNWGLNGSNGLSWSVIGSGTDALGWPYVDVKVSGTASAVAQPSVAFEGSTQVAAANGQSWSASAYHALIAGAWNATSATIEVAARNAGGAIVQTAASVAWTPGAARARAKASGTFTDATTAFVSTALRLNFASGAVVDATLRLSVPQLEQGAHASSPIVTSGAAVTRARDEISLAGAALSTIIDAAGWAAAIEWTPEAPVAGSDLLSVRGTGAVFDELTPSSGGLQLLGKWAGGNASTAVSGAVTVGSLNKAAGRLSAAGGMAVLNGSTIRTVANNGAMITRDAAWLGSLAGAAASSGVFKRMALFPPTIADATLQGMTA